MSKLPSTTRVNETETLRPHLEERLHFLDCMDQINQIIYRSENVEKMLWEVLEKAFSMFGCDRIWLFHPCDPDATTYTIPVEIARKEYPGAGTLKIEVPMRPSGDTYCSKALATDGPVVFGPETDPPIFQELTAQFGVLSQMAMAIYPRVGRPWMIGMHQCSHSRIWTPAEHRLFEAIARRIGEGLSTLLLLGDLKETQERLDLAVKGSRDGLWDWPDVSHDAMWWSPRVFEITGYTPKEITPSLEILSELIHPDDREGVRMALLDHLRGGEAPFEAEYRLKAKSGEYLWIWARGMSVRNGDGRVRRMSGSLQDISDRKRAEHELKKYQDHLEELVDERTARLIRTNTELEAAYKDLEAFSFTVSHDLRSPLAPIIGFAKILRNHQGQVLDDKAAELLGEIIGQSEKMLCLIDDLLELAQVGHVSGPVELESSHKILKDTIKELKEDYPEAEHLIQVRGNLPLVRIHRVHLSQIFSNFLINALRYAGKEGLPIEVSGEKMENQIRITVLDHGPGISGREKERVFQAFYRGTFGKKLSGTGIGLAIIARIAKSYGGKAWVEDTPRGGCTFHVLLQEK